MSKNYIQEETITRHKMHNGIQMKTTLNWNCQCNNDIPWIPFPTQCLISKPRHRVMIHYPFKPQDKWLAAMLLN